MHELSFPGARAVPWLDAARGLAMSNMVQYRCFFLDSTGAVRSDEMIECWEDQDAVETARDMLEHRPHYHGIELWRGARRVHMEVRLPDIPTFTIRTAQGL
jgi:hypothetical protein